MSGSPSYLRAVACKCALSGLFTASLAVWSVFFVSAPCELALPFGVYFAFDTVTAVALDQIFKPKRQHTSYLEMAHHVVGVVSMYTTPSSDVCMTSYRLVTVAEFSTPLLYLSNYYRFVLGREAPWALSATMVYIAWPILRLLAPVVSAYLQFQGFFGGTGYCGVSQLLIIVGYFFMNAYYLSLIRKRHLMNHSAKTK